ncbi:MAG: PAS domain S-box protein [Bacteroidota bacterium]
MYKLFFDNSPLGSFIAEENGNLKAYNKAFLNDMGYDNKHDLLMDKGFNFNHVLTDFNAINRGLSNENRSLEFETYIKLKDNSLKPIKLHCSHFSDESDKKLIVGSISHLINHKNAGISLADERKKYEDIMNNSVQLIQSFDKNGQLLFVNSAWKNLFGYTDEEISSINLFDIIADEDKAHCAEIFQNILKGVPAFDIKANFISKSGNRIFLKGNVLPMLSNGELIATHAFFNDISELNVMRGELASKEVLLETIFKSIPVCLYLKDYEGRYIFANDMMIQTLGCDVSGKTDNEIFDAESAAIMKSTDKEAINHENRNTNFTFTLQQKDTKKHFFCGKKPIKTNQQDNLIFGYTIDITELKNKTLKVEENERILDQIVSNTNTGIMLLKLDPKDGKFKLDFLNNTCKKIINFKEGQSELSELLPELQLNANFNEKQDIIASQVYEYEVDKSGNSHSYDVFINHIDLPDSDHKLLVFFNEVTEKKRMIEHLELKLKENLLLLSEVHHRVKNNLANIYGIIELNKYKFQNTDFERYLVEVQLKIKSIALVHELLYKSKSISSISIDEYFTELCQEHAKIYKFALKLNVQFQLKFDKQVKIELGRAISLGLMLGELLSNSLKYAAKDSYVEIGISLKLENGRCYITYHDSGNGFDTSPNSTFKEGFGLKLIKNVLKQSKANFNLNTQDKFHLSFDFEQV